MKTQVFAIKNASSYFSGWKLLNGKSVSTWSQNKDDAILYSSEELAKFKTLRDFRRLGTVSVENM